MARYIVLTAEAEEPGEAPLFTESEPPVLCDTVDEVGPVVRQARRDGDEWMVVEIVDGRAKRRALTFRPDGSIKAIE